MPTKLLELFRLHPTYALEHLLARAELCGEPGVRLWVSMPGRFNPRVRWGGYIVLSAPLLYGRAYSIWYLDPWMLDIRCHDSVYDEYSRRVLRFPSN